MSVRSAEAQSGSRLARIPTMPFPACTAESVIRSSIRSIPGPLTTGLREALLKALARPTEPWLPELAWSLTAAAWEEYRQCGFDSENYGTHRWLHKDPRARRMEIAALDLGNSLECRIEELPTSTQIRYEGRGLAFSKSTSLAADVTAVRSALSIVSLVPSLHETIAAYLRALHILKAPGSDFDVSHSDPEVPFSVFVSIPPSCPEAELRLAESVVHECMHLQLTMIEAITPLVRNNDFQAFSPWKQTARPLGGILHGLYVACVIYFWFLSLNEKPASTVKKFVDQRIRTAGREIRQTAWLANSDGLTDAGRVLARQILRVQV